MAAFYNEPDRHKAAWLRNLIEEGAIAHGVVDERPIQAVQPDDVRGFAQCHWFAGIGVFSHALRLAGWPDDRPVWTGSCPCGPFSAAGLRKGFDDPRHLWPEWFRLIGERRPRVLFGEQVAAADAWVDLVSADLEGAGYAVGSPDLCAAGFRGAHIRQRYFWVADADNSEWWSERAPWHDGQWPAAGRVQGDRDARQRGGDGGMADADLSGLGRLEDAGLRRPEVHDLDGCGSSVRVGDTSRRGRQERGDAPFSGSGGHADGADPFGWLGSPSQPGLSDAQYGIVRRTGRRPEGRAALEPGDPSRPGVDWLFCRDSRWRPVEPGSSPLVDAHPARMALLRGFGDAIDAETAAEFVRAYLAEAPANSDVHQRVAA